MQGKEFSANYVVDSNGHIFRLGENICFKRRNDGNTGPICDGTGSISINNSLPFLTKQDIEYIEEKIIKPFHAFVEEKTREKFCTFLNVDLMKREDGNIVLFEINCREAGGHTMANILSGLRNGLYEILLHAQDGALDKVTPDFKEGASVVVSAFPYYFPYDVDKEDEKLIIEVTKEIPERVKVYTGWVDVLESGLRSRTMRLHNSPVLLFECFDNCLENARNELYGVIEHVVQGRLDYRKDIGSDVG